MQLRALDCMVAEGRSNDEHSRWEELVEISPRDNAVQQASGQRRFSGDIV